jgi:hypothetical protein
VLGVNGNSLHECVVRGEKVAERFEEGCRAARTVRGSVVDKEFDPVVVGHVFLIRVWRMSLGAWGALTAVRHRGGNTRR